MVLVLGAYTTMAEAEKKIDPETHAFVIDCHLSRGQSGKELLRKIREGKTGVPKDTIVIMTSGDHRLRQESLDAGADKFLLKPYPPDTLSQELNSLLSVE